jgi:hypothetical protein
LDFDTSSNDQEDVAEKPPVEASWWGRWGQIIAAQSIISYQRYATTKLLQMQTCHLSWHQKDYTWRAFQSLCNISVRTLDSHLCRAK